MVAGGGTVSWDELRRMAEDGRLQPADLVKEEGESGWTRADAVPGLGPVDILEEVADEPATPPTQNPHLIPCQSCGQDIAKEARKCPNCGAANCWTHPEIARFLSKRKRFCNIPDLEIDAHSFVLTGRSTPAETFAGNLADMLGRMWFFGSPMSVIFVMLETKWIAQELREIAGPAQQTFVVDFHTDPPAWKSTDDYYGIKVMEFFGLPTDSLRRPKKTSSWPKLLFKLGLNYVVYPFLAVVAAIGLVYLAFMALKWWMSSQ